MCIAKLSMDQKSIGGFFMKNLKSRIQIRKKKQNRPKPKEVSPQQKATDECKAQLLSGCELGTPHSFSPFSVSIRELIEARGNVLRYA